MGLEAITDPVRYKKKSKFFFDYVLVVLIGFIKIVLQKLLVNLRNFWLTFSG